MIYEIFLYTKTIADDWNFHVVPSAFSKPEKDELRRCIVNGLYAQFPGVARSDVEKLLPKNIGLNYNYCYCLPFNDHSLILILARISEFVDATGRPFWDFAGAYITEQRLPLKELQTGITQLLTQDILFKIVEELVDQSKPAPSKPNISKRYQLEVDIPIDSSQAEEVPVNESSDIQFPKLSKEMVTFDSTNHENFQVLLSRINDAEEPIIFFTYGPVNKSSFSEKLAAFRGIDNTNSQSANKTIGIEQQNTENQVSDIHTRRHLLLDLLTNTLSYSLGVVDTVTKNRRKSKKQDDIK